VKWALKRNKCIGMEWVFIDCRIPVGYFESGIYARAIKRIYDRERGAEVVDALHASPAVAVPIVLKRLKQKDEEWRRSQREWNKVWQDIEAKSFTRSLDYQSSLFKIADKKGLTRNGLVGEIEGVYREQGRDAGEEGSRYQFDFSFRMPDVQRDLRKLVVRSVSEAGSPDEDLTQTRAGVNSFLRTFFGRFFCNGGEEFGRDDDDEFEDGVVGREASPGSDMDTDDEAREGGVKSRGPRRGLMVKKMKESLEKSNKEVVGKSHAGKSVFAFYADSQLYTLFRLYQVLMVLLTVVDALFETCKDQGAFKGIV
jgi:paired amphipathic helix protein Sin3a